MACTLEFTDKRFVVDGKSYPDLPLMVDSNHRFIEVVCTYFRHLVLVDKLKVSSVGAYARYLSYFWNYLEFRGIDYRAVRDKELTGWLNEQEAQGVGAKTRCARCDAVFDFYVWAEVNRHTEYAVRIPGWNDSEKFTPLLTSVIVAGNSGQRFRSSKNGIVSAVRPRVPSDSFISTPDADDLTKLYVASDDEKNPGLTERHHLLIGWYSQVGLRRKEWRLLTVDQIPSWDAIFELRQRNEAHELLLTQTKGDRIRHVGVIPELLEKTREYIEGARQEIVDRFAEAKKDGYRVPKEIFLSEKTGQSLSLTSISNLLTQWFKRASVPGHGHRLRATYLTNLFEAELIAEEYRLLSHGGTKGAVDYELVLRKVAERAGHADIESLRPYLTLARKRRIREGYKTDPVVLQQEIDARKQDLALLEQRIEQKKKELSQLKESKAEIDSA